MDEEQNKRGTGFLKGCLCGCLTSVGLIMLYLIIIGIVGYHAFSKSMKWFSGSNGSLQAEIAGIDDVPQLEEVWSCGSLDGKKVARIKLSGIITLSTFDDELFGIDEASPLFALKSIKAATADEDVMGIILEIDSPGGGVTDSDLIYHALKKFRLSKEGRRVLVVMGDICASGGYYIASAADYIVAHPTTMLGSIGVKIESFNLKQMADKLGIVENPIVSGENKSMGGILGDLTDGQRQILQSIVDGAFERFVGLVSEGRSISKEEVLKIADGRVMTAKDGVQCKLVDSIGYFEDGCKAMEKQLSCDDIYVVRYRSDAILSGFKNFPKSFGKAVIDSLQESSTSRIVYK